MSWWADPLNAIITTVLRTPDGLVREDQRARAGARVTQTRHPPPRAAVPARPDRHLGARLPQIELADLARPIHGPLKRPRRRDDRPDLAQIVVQDRLAAGIAELDQ